MVTPFVIAVPDAVLDDLRERVRASRFTVASSTTSWASGVDPAYLRDLALYWSERFDWRAAESRLNAFPQFTARVEGIQTHFVHLRAETHATGESPGRTTPPLLLAHGWPSSFVEMLALADRLAHPSRYGAPGAPAFDVVIPSLPGFLFSGLPPAPLTRSIVGETFHELMTGVLGYDSYGLFGGDIGGASAAWTAAAHPDAVAGIVQIHPSFPSDFDEPVTPEEQSFLDREAAYDEFDGGYSAIMITRPDTIAAALVDSPIGLAAWIVDKYRDWSDCDGELGRRFDYDTLLTIITLYWATGCIGSSFRQYADCEINGKRASVTVPAAFTLSTEPGLAGFPRSIAERAFTDIRRWNTPGRGGHFLAHEEPDLAASELREFFGSLLPLA